MRFCAKRAPSTAFERNRPPRRAARFPTPKCGLALAGFEPALRLVDDVDTAFTAHDTAITMPVLERPKRVPNLHGSLLVRGALCAWLMPPRGGDVMVGDTGIEPVTPSMSTKCSTAELIARPAVSSLPKKNKTWVAPRRSGVYKRFGTMHQGLLAIAKIAL